jgi:hypothetical protein
MPYVNAKSRRFLDNGGIPVNAGELNYCITRLIQKYLKPETSYQKYNDVMGVLEGVKLEIYRRKIASYEDGKIEENGDVY